MFKKRSLFFMIFIVVCFPIFSNACQTDEELERINKTLFILKGTKNHAVVMRDAMKTGDVFPPLERLKEASIQFLMGKDFNIETSEQKKRIFEDALYRQLFMDALFFENLENMFFMFKKGFEHQKENVSSLFLKGGYGIILNEIEGYLLKTQISFLQTFSDLFGQTEAFHTKYYGFDFTREGGAFVLSGGRVTDNEKLYATKFCMSVKDSIQKETHYSKTQIFNFKECMDELASSSFDFTATLSEVLLADFSEVVQLYEILEEGNDRERSRDDPMYGRFCDFSKKAHSNYLRLGEKVYEITSPQKAEQYLKKEARVDLDPKMSKYFDGIRDQFFWHLKEVSIERMAKFERIIGKLKNDAEKERKALLKKKKNAVKNKSKNDASQAQLPEAEDERTAREGEEASSELEMVSESVKSLEHSIGAAQGAAQEDRTSEEAVQGEAAADLNENLDPWWTSYQKAPKEKSRNFQGGSGEASSSLRVKLTRKAFRFFSVMGGHSLWDPNLDLSDFNAFQSEIFRETEAFLGKDVSLHPVLLKARHFARPPLILPNLNPKSKASEPYLLFRMPHLPHGREENRFYPALRNFYAIYFQEAGLSRENIIEK
ncbi:MAG: hypothetical protein B7Y25_02705 [Alphaproteobacteria bacterium 16-39-46]|nr:MAG: hypothetical protein B7Y25_02705 [Alphaproteobacteria bacterium 16-39-46]OZA43550.1 MAG: hypothetical protein B7X84_02875 [Alphaproteobacteria bacterium 17-39-52]HQS83807.1 hypothetical protein [Alphaproteobacteria bacterium]HQS93590.1 hypothetical protein [Alphaproteobacteria bacterium]